MSISSKRIEWIDICKFFAIALVVWLHFGVPARIDGLVHQWHMPIFYMLSGLCFNFEKHSDFKKFLFSRVKSLLIPYLLFSVILYTIWSVIYLCRSSQEIVPLKLYLRSLLFTNTTAVPNLWGSVQWFLTSLFFTETLNWICSKVANICPLDGDKSSISCCISVFLAGLGFWFSKVAGFRLPIAIDTAFPMLFFYAIGNWMRNKEIMYKAKEIPLWKKGILLITTGGICLCCYFINGDTNVRQLQFGNPLHYVIGATAGCFMMMFFSMMICDFNLSKYKVFQSMLYIGQGTLIVLYVHRVYIGAINVFLVPRFPFLNQYPVFILLTVIFFALIAYPSCAIVNNYFPFLIGKKYK